MGNENKSYVNLPPWRKSFKTTTASIAYIDPGRPSEFLATCHALLPLHHRPEHCWEVLVVHPPWQPIKKQLEFCRAIGDKGHSPGCSICITAPHYPQGIINSQEQYNANQSEGRAVLKLVYACKDQVALEHGLYFCCCRRLIDAVLRHVSVPLQYVTPKSKQDLHITCNSSQECKQVQFDPPSSSRSIYI